MASNSNDIVKKMENSMKKMLRIMSIEFSIGEFVMIAILLHFGLIDENSQIFYIINLFVVLIEIVLTLKKVEPATVFCLCWIRSSLFSILFCSSSRLNVYIFSSISARSPLFFFRHQKHLKKIYLISVALIVAGISWNRICQPERDNEPVFFLCSNAWIALQALIDIAFLILFKSSEREFMKKVRKRTHEMVGKRARFIRLSSHSTKNTFTGILPILKKLKKNLTHHENPKIQQSFRQCYVYSKISQLIIENVLKYQNIVTHRMEFSNRMFDFNRKIFRFLEEEIKTSLQTTKGIHCKIERKGTEFPGRCEGDPDLIQFLIKNCACAVSSISKSNEMHLIVQYDKEREFIEFEINFESDLQLKGKTDPADRKERFDSRTREGLFLFVAEKYVQLIGGSLDTDRAGQVSLQLPLPITTENATDENPLEEPENERQSFMDRTQLEIMVVEDNPICSRVLCFQIQNAGQNNICVCMNGQIALNKIKYEGYRPDIIFSDFDMPILNGGEFARAVRLGNYLSESCWLYLVTGASFQKMRKDVVFEYGVKEVISKPSHPSIIKEKLDCCLERKYRYHLTQQMVSDFIGHRRQSLGDDLRDILNDIPDLPNSMKMRIEEERESESVPIKLDLEPSTTERPPKEIFTCSPFSKFLQEMRKAMNKMSYELLLGIFVVFGVGYFTSENGVPAFRFLFLWGQYFVVNCILIPMVNSVLPSSLLNEGVFRVLFGVLRRMLVSFVFPVYSLLMIAGIYETASFLQDVTCSLLVSSFVFSCFLAREVYHYFERFVPILGDCNVIQGFNETINNNNNVCIEPFFDERGYRMLTPLQMNVKIIVDLGVTVFISKHMLKAIQKLEELNAIEEKSIEKLNEEDRKLEFVTTFLSSEHIKMPFSRVDYFSSQLLDLLNQKKNNFNSHSAMNSQEEEIRLSCLFFNESVLQFRKDLCNQEVSSSNKKMKMETLNYQKTLQYILTEQLKPFQRFENHQFFKFVVEFRFSRPSLKNDFFVQFDSNVLEIVVSNILQIMVQNYDTLRFKNLPDFKSTVLRIVLSYDSENEFFQFRVSDEPGIPISYVSPVLCESSRSVFLSLYEHKKEIIKKNITQNRSFLNSLFFENKKLENNVVRNPFPYLGLFNCYQIAETLCGDPSFDGMKWKIRCEKERITNEFVFSCPMKMMKKKKVGNCVAIENCRVVLRLKDDLLMSKNNEFDTHYTRREIIKMMFLEHGVDEKNVRFVSLEESTFLSQKVDYDIFVVDVDEVVEMERWIEFFRSENVVETNVLFVLLSSRCGAKKNWWNEFTMKKRESSARFLCQPKPLRSFEVVRYLDSVSAEEL